MKTITFKLDKPGFKDLVVPFLVEGETVEVYGMVDAHEPGEYGVRVLSDHIVRRTFGRVVIKGVASNGARVSIDGMVKIGPDAAKTDSFLEMRMLLLDKKSSSVVEPKLEIENNDVKASHAATVGKIDEEQIFYLTSRGVAEDEAKRLIVEGFLKEIKEMVENSPGETVSD
jgi:Fe-S cluster assembly protein SufD